METLSTTQLLVLGPDWDTLQAMATLSADRPARVRWARSRHQALSLLGQHDVDVMVLDVRSRPGTPERSPQPPCLEPLPVTAEEGLRLLRLLQMSRKLQTLVVLQAEDAAQREAYLRAGASYVIVRGGEPPLAEQLQVALGRLGSERRRQKPRTPCLQALPA